MDICVYTENVQISFFFWFLFIRDLNSSISRSPSLSLSNFPMTIPTYNMPLPLHFSHYVQRYMDVDNSNWYLIHWHVLHKLGKLGFGDKAIIIAIQGLRRKKSEIWMDFKKILETLKATSCLLSLLILGIFLFLSLFLKNEKVLQYSMKAALDNCNWCLD